MKKEIFETIASAIPHLIGGKGYVAIEEKNGEIVTYWQLNKPKTYYIDCRKWREAYLDDDYLELAFREWILDNEKEILEGIQNENK